MLSLLLSFLSVSGKDHEWAASPLHLRSSVWPACTTCWVPFKLSSGPFNFEPELYPGKQILEMYYLQIVFSWFLKVVSFREGKFKL